MQFVVEKWTLVAVVEPTSKGFLTCDLEDEFDATHDSFDVFRGTQVSGDGYDQSGGGGNAWNRRTLGLEKGGPRDLLI